jgi:4-diphosphocytidyl-2-C-methyl-D-erythritol kinase
VRIEIEKRIPVAAGLGGGSADAAAVLRLAGDEVDGLSELAAELGADVPSQLDQAFALVGGAGEVVEPLPPPRHFGVVRRADDGLSTAEVYAETGSVARSRSGRARFDRRELRELAAGVAARVPRALVNDPYMRRCRCARDRGALTRSATRAEVALVTGRGRPPRGLDDIAAPTPRRGSWRRASPVRSSGRIRATGRRREMRRERAPARSRSSAG